ncbi:MAG: lipoprotein, partial [Bacteroidales bacterium]|nr:lipoprotein [Bacteroidales bacterium]
MKKLLIIIITIILLTGCA